MKTSDPVEIFNEFTCHLTRDETPSEYFTGISDEAYFKQPPFDMLFRLKDTEQSAKHHPEGNVWNHTLLVIDEAACLKSKSRDARVFMWASLLHDIGKPSVTKKKGDKITAYNHDKTGARLAEKFLLALTDDTEFIRKVASLVKWHMQPFYIEKNLPFADIRTMKQQTDISEVALISFADRLGRPQTDRNDAEQCIDRFIKRCGL